MTIREKFRVEPESSGPTVKKAAGREAKLCYLGHLLTENRNAWVIDTQLIQVTGRADHEAALAMVEKLPVWRPLTRCADKVYEITALRASCATIGSRRTWRESPGPQLTDAPAAIPNTSSASSGTNASKKPSVGSRPTPVAKDSPSRCRPSGFVDVYLCAGYPQHRAHAEDDRVGEALRNIVVQMSERLLSLEYRLLHNKQRIFHFARLDARTVRSMAVTGMNSLIATSEVHDSASPAGS